ncbi:MAG: hypothetical protein SCG79_06575 [Nitrosomonadaceae bacterium]|nr:hypothetical protein [Nitrosospira sp.]MDW7565679.1 hypothetical protein [Nitrosomonadaceae bacterium]MBI0409358.1 hypothetical protein [Nitrosospira sp.]MBI0410349.1 hypothetical protein [Nitrosospira sp.]MBI0411930.1 hypothetical protein [Nitrosospira sp.]
MKFQSGDIPRNLAILSMPTLRGVMHLHLIGGGVAAGIKQILSSAR